MVSGHKITVGEPGRAGIPIAVPLEQHNEVTGLDIDQALINLINQDRSIEVDAKIHHYLFYKKLALTPTLNKREADKDPAFVIAATSTSFDLETN